MNKTVKISDSIDKWETEFEDLPQSHGDISKTPRFEHDESVPGHFRFVVTLNDRLWMIEHSLDLGDGLWADKLLAEFGPAIVATEDSDLLRRVGIAQERLLRIKEHEAQHGLYSLLKRESRWIKSQEAFCKRKGLPSPYRVPGSD